MSKGSASANSNDTQHSDSGRRVLPDFSTNDSLHVVICVVKMRSNGRHFASSSAVIYLNVSRLRVEDFNRESTWALFEPPSSGTHAPEC